MSRFYTAHKMATSSYKCERDMEKTLNAFFLSKYVLRHILSLQKHVLTTNSIIITNMHRRFENKNKQNNIYLFLILL